MCSSDLFHDEPEVLEVQVYLAETYNPGFKIDLHFKDLGLIMESARALGVPLPTTAVVQELFSALRVKGRGSLDHSGVITLLEDFAGLSR